MADHCGPPGPGIPPGLSLCSLLCFNLDLEAFFKKARVGYSEHLVSPSIPGISFSSFPALHTRGCVRQLPAESYVWSARTRRVWLGWQDKSGLCLLTNSSWIHWLGEWMKPGFEPEWAWNQSSETAQGWTRTQPWGASASLSAVQAFQWNSLL